MVVGFTLDGVERFRAPLSGTQAPRVAWNPRTHTGLVFMDSLVRWLDADGRPSEASIRPGLGFQTKGDVAAVGDGFVVMIGANSYSSPPPLYAARMPPRPVDAIEFEVVADGGPRAVPEHATDAAGFATFAVSLLWGSGSGEVWRLDVPDAPALEAELSVPGALDILGVVQRDGTRLALHGNGSTGGDHYLTDIDAGETALVTQVPSGLTGHLELLGGAIVGAFRDGTGGTPEPIVVAELALEGEVVRGMIPLSERGRLAHSPRLARTPRGLAIVWSEATGDTDGMSARLAVLDCCP